MNDIDSYNFNEIPLIRMILRQDVQLIETTIKKQDEIVLNQLNLPFATFQKLRGLSYWAVNILYDCEHQLYCYISEATYLIQSTV